MFNFFFLIWFHFIHFIYLFLYFYIFAFSESIIILNWGGPKQFFLHRSRSWSEFFHNIGIPYSSNCGRVYQRLSFLLKCLTHFMYHLFLGISFFEACSQLYQSLQGYLCCFGLILLWWVILCLHNSSMLCTFSA